MARGFSVARCQDKFCDRVRGEVDCTKFARYRCAAPFSQLRSVAPRDDTPPTSAITARQILRLQNLRDRSAVWLFQSGAPRKEMSILPRFFRGRRRTSSATESGSEREIAQRWWSRA